MLVGLVPAAGHARRLGARSGSKEMLEVGGRPVIDYLIDRLLMVGPVEIRVTTRPEKTDLIEHLGSLGVEIILGNPASVSESLLAGTVGLDPHDEVVFGFPDTLWEPVDGFVPVLARLRDSTDVSLGLFRLTPSPTDSPPRTGPLHRSADALQRPSEALHRSDVVTLDRSGQRVLRIAVKPSHPESDLIWGCAATHVRVIRSLRDDPEPGICFARIARHGRVAATVLSNSWLDIGTPESLASAHLLFG